METSVQQLQPGYEIMPDLELKNACFAAAERLAHDLATLSYLHLEYWRLVRLPETPTSASAQPITTFEQQHSPDSERLDVRLPWNGETSIRSRMGVIPSGCWPQSQDIKISHGKENISINLGFARGDRSATFAERLVEISFSFKGVQLCTFLRQHDRELKQFEKDALIDVLRFCDKLHEAVVAHQEWIREKNAVVVKPAEPKSLPTARPSLVAVLGSGIVSS